MGRGMYSVFNINDVFILNLPKRNRMIKSLELGAVIERVGRETGNYISPKYPKVTYEERALPKGE